MVDFDLDGASTAKGDTTAAAETTGKAATKFVAEAAPEAAAVAASPAQPLPLVEQAQTSGAASLEDPAANGPLEEPREEPREEPEEAVCHEQDARSAEDAGTADGGDRESDLQSAVGAVIWPGRRAVPGEAATPRDEVTAAGELHRPWTAVRDPEVASSDGAVLEPPPGDQLLQSGPAVVLQNPAGSLVAPHTWRYLQPPPSEPSQPAPTPRTAAATPEEDSSLKANGAMAELPVVNAIRGDEATLGANDKRQLLMDIIECVARRATDARKNLDRQRRDARAMRVTQEALQWQIQQLQQQLAIATQCTGVA